MTTYAPLMDPVVPPDTDRPIDLRSKVTGADRTFNMILGASSAVVLFILVAMVIFLVINAVPALKMSGFSFLWDLTWSPDSGHFGIAALLAGTVAIAVIGVAVATPISIATALMINEYAPTSLRRWLTATVDMLATIPSIVYGFWGLELFSRLQAGPARWLSQEFGFVPVLRTPSHGSFVKSIFACGLVCAITIVPIITSVSREVMSQAPRDVCEAAYGLGGTRWGMVTNVIFPFSKDGIVGAVLLGFGRGLGETMIVALVLSSANIVTPGLLGPNGLGSIPKEITDRFPAGSPIEKSGLILLGLVLFLTVLAVNIVAKAIMSRTGSSSK
jgi:phosphate transport system permease protein